MFAFDICTAGDGHGGGLGPGGRVTDKRCAMDVSMPKPFAFQIHPCVRSAQATDAAAAEGRSIPSASHHGGRDYY